MKPGNFDYTAMVVKSMQTPDGTNELRALLIARSEIACAELRLALKPLQGVRVDTLVWPTRHLAARFSGVTPPNALLVDFEKGDAADLEIIRSIRSDGHGSHVPIVVLLGSGAELSPLQVMRSGADDVIVKPINVAEAMEVLGRLLELPHTGRRPASMLGKTVAFAHVCGGAGATTLAVNTASALVGTPGPIETCLIDLDIQFGNAASLLDLTATSPIDSFIEDPRRLDREMLENMMTRHSSGLHILTAPRASLPLDAFRPEDISALLQVAKRRFAFSVIDLPIAVAPWTEAVLAGAEFVYLVAPLSVPSAYRLAKFLELIRRNDMLHLPLKIVVNRYNAGLKRSNDISIAQFAKAIGRNVDHMIPNDYPLISMSHGQGKPAVRLEPKSPFAMAVKEMISADLGANLFPKAKRGLLSFRSK